MITACPQLVGPAIIPSLPRMTPTLLVSRVVRTLQSPTHALSLRAAASTATQSAAAAETDPALVRRDVNPAEAAPSSQHGPALRQDRITIDGRFISSPLPPPEQPPQTAPPPARLSAYVPHVPPVSEEVRGIGMPTPSYETCKLHNEPCASRSSSVLNDVWQASRCCMECVA
jgi:hypothetical protein